MLHAKQLWARLRFILLSSYQWRWRKPHFTYEGASNNDTVIYTVWVCSNRARPSATNRCTTSPQSEARSQSEHISWSPRQLIPTSADDLQLVTLTQGAVFSLNLHTDAGHLEGSLQPTSTPALSFMLFLNCPICRHLSCGGILLLLSLPKAFHVCTWKVEVLK